MKKFLLSLFVIVLLSSVSSSIAQTGNAKAYVQAHKWHLAKFPCDYHGGTFTTYNDVDGALTTNGGVPEHETARIVTFLNVTSTEFDIRMIDPLDKEEIKQLNRADLFQDRILQHITVLEPGRIKIVEHVTMLDIPSLMKGVAKYNGQQEENIYITCDVAN
jgi:hypothetical protein